MKQPSPLAPRSRARGLKARCGPTHSAAKRVRLLFISIALAAAATALAGFVVSASKVRWTNAASSTASSFPGLRRDAALNHDRPATPSHLTKPLSSESSLGDGIQYFGGSTEMVEPATLTVASLTVDKQFVPASMFVGCKTRLILTIDNSTFSPASGVFVNDSLPGGLQVANPANSSNTCFGTFAPSAGDTSIVLSNGFVSLFGSCQVSVDITATTTGVKLNTTDPVFWTLGAGSPSNTASLTVFGTLAFTVNNNGDGHDANAGDGACETANGNGICTLRAAIEEANALSSCGPIGPIDINFIAGLSSPITLGTALPAINHDVNLNGPGASLLTVQRNTGSGPFRIFTINGGKTVKVDGLTITNGNVFTPLAEIPGNNFGGGIFNSGALTITNSTVSENFTSDGTAYGGGIYNDAAGTLIINNSTVSSNHVTSNTNDGGGGIFNNGGTVTITDSTLSDNSADNAPSTNPTVQGGAIYNAGGTLTITNSTLSHNTVQGGSNNYGGGVYSSGGTLNFTNSTFSVNLALNGLNNQGGGIYMTGGSISITSSTLSDNSATGNAFTNYGGGIYKSGGSLTMTGSTLHKNTVGSGNGIQNFGAGIYTTGGTSAIANSTLSGNFALGPLFSSNLGGGIYTGDTLTVTNSTLSGNSVNGSGAGSANGGGIYNAIAGQLTLINSTLSGNFVSGSSNGNNGGGIYSDAGSLTVTNSTLSANSVSGSGSFLNDGGGIYNAGASTANIRNTIIAGNTAPTNPPGIPQSAQDVFGSFNSQGHNLIGKVNGANGFSNGNNGDQVGLSAAPKDPMLGPLASNGGPTQTMALLSGSSAIDAGDGCVFDNSCSPSLGFAITTDQRGMGFSRKVDGNSDGTAAVDIGAYEAAVCTTPPATPTASNGGPYCAGATIQLSTPSVSGATYAWTGPNGFTSSLQNPTRTSATTADAGTYSVTVTVNGCTSAAGTTNVVVNATPATPTASNGGPYCDGQTIQLSTPVVSGATYSWTGPNGFTSSLQNPTRTSATTADAGTYSITVTVNGCPSAAGTTNVVVNATPATPTASNGGPYCDGATIQLSTPFVSGATYAWTGPNGFTSSAQNPTRTNAATADSGTYVVTVTVNGCTSAAGSTNVIVNDCPDPPAGTDNTVTMAEDTAYTFTAADFGFTDPHDSPPNTLLAVKITTLPALGKLLNNNVPVHAGDFISVTNLNSSLLKFTPAVDGNGTPYTTFTFQLQDNGGGTDLDPTPNTMTINVTPVNDTPSFTKGPDQSASKNSGPQSVPNWATNISAGPANESGQTVSFQITGNTNPGLFSAGPAVSSTGTLSYTPALNQVGSATITLVAKDNGGTANGGVETSASQAFVITITSVDLTVSKTHSGTFTQSDTGKTYTITVSNVGTDPSSGQVTLAENLPAGLIARSLSGTGWTCDAIPAGGTAGPATINCTRSDSVAANGGAYASLTLTVDVSCTAPASVNNSATVSGGGDATPGNNTANDPTTVNKDSTPPVITCPGGITRFTDSGQNTATINPGTAVATDNCGTPTVTGVRSDGKPLNAPYPVGITVITWTAKDAANNTASCAQSIAVMVPSGPRRHPGDEEEEALMAGVNLVIAYFATFW